MNFLFAWRYFRAKKTTNAINVIAWISISAIAIGTAALILVLSVFNGLEDLVKSLYSSFYPDIRISPVSGKQITLTQDQLNKIRSVKGVQNVSLIVEEKALLQNGEYQSIIYLKGVDDNYTNVTSVAQHMLKGNFNLGNDDFPLLVLGAGVENAVSVQSDRSLNPLVVYLSKKNEVSLSNPMESVSADTIHTSGAFFIQQEFDNKYAFTNLLFVKRMLGMPENEYGSVELAINPTEKPDEVKENLMNVLGKDYLVQTRYEQNQSLYSVMQGEKWFIYAILSLILIVATFNMVGALTMLVLEKQHDISVLQALGGSRQFVQKIFLSEGLLLGILGGIAGMLIAALLAWLQVHFKLIPLEEGSFLIDYYPVKLSVYDFLQVGSTVLVIAALASWIPARKAARQQISLRAE